MAALSVNGLKSGCFNQFPLFSLQLSEKLEYHHLEISDVTMEDAGKYTCVICNNAGEETLATELIVYERPKPRGKEREAPNISKELQDETVTEGDRVQLQAKVKGTVLVLVRETMGGGGGQYKTVRIPKENTFSTPSLCNCACYCKF